MLLSWSHQNRSSNARSQCRWTKRPEGFSESGGTSTSRIRRLGRFESCSRLFLMCVLICVVRVVFGHWPKPIVSVESEGPYTPERLLLEAIKVMREKLAVITEAAVTLRDKYASFDNDISMADAWFKLCPCSTLYIYVFNRFAHAF